MAHRRHELIEEKLLNLPNDTALGEEKSWELSVLFFR